VDAINHLSRGLEVLTTVPETPERIRYELFMRTLLGSALIAIKGWGAPEVEHTYARARALCQQMNDQRQRIPVLVGLAGFYTIRTEFQVARELGEQALRLAHHQRAATSLELTHCILGGIMFFLGELATAQHHLEQGVALYDPMQHRDLVSLCVIDPGVGSFRRAIALHAGDWLFVGPDNGLFSYVMAEQTVHAAVLLSNSTYHLPGVSSTFHGRDIFAPVGAYLARGLTEIFHKLGPSVDPATLRHLEVGGTTRRGTTIDAHIVHVDNFGNLITSIPLSLVPELYTASQVRIVFPHEGVIVEKRRQFFADGPDDGQAFIYGDSSGYVGIAVRNGNAAKTLGVGFGVTISFITSAG